MNYSVLAEQVIKPEAFFKDGEVVTTVVSLCVGGGQGGALWLNRN